MAKTSQLSLSPYYEGYNMAKETLPKLDISNVVNKEIPQWVCSYKCFYEPKTNAYNAYWKGFNDFLNQNSRRLRNHN